MPPKLPATAARRLVYATGLVVTLALPAGLRADAVADQLDTVRAVGREGEGLTAAANAARTLSAMRPADLPQLLAGFDGAGPVAANLLRSAAESVADRAAAAGQPLPAQELETFARDTSHDPRARRLTYELLLRSDPTLADRMLPGMLSDPSPDFRRDAVARRITAAKAADGTAAVTLWREALSGAVDEDQVKDIVAALKEAGVEVDVARHFGFITTWQGIGPFDNRGGVGFGTGFPPEKTPGDAIDPEAVYPGQSGDVQWRPVTAENEYGLISIGKEWGNNKGSGMDFAATFESAAPRDVELRLSTPNAWKLWLNGELLFGREEYHRGKGFDMYAVPAQLQPGTNRILLKVLQNEQTQDWAQRYEFQLRVADPSGAGVVPVGVK